MEQNTQESTTKRKKTGHKLHWPAWYIKPKSRF